MVSRPRTNPKITSHPSEPLSSQQLIEFLHQAARRHHPEALKRLFALVLAVSLDILLAPHNHTSPAQFHGIHSFPLTLPVIIRCDRRRVICNTRGTPSTIAYKLRKEIHDSVHLLL
ncbi:hypothetical protein THAR02_09661 [Trichoderma harzianum]|uniref:Uncharacterized protein n=1 Tax=Trichoderma harzianum TaxID=5544 RepID=A0A0F9ZCN7_TRIHA|nr:hypothetical protein THAR02_09661 [Trichoderma harzianum]